MLKYAWICWGRRHYKDFKKNAVRLSYASNKPVAGVARDLDISDAILHRWRQKYTAEGDKTRFATMDEENKALRLKVAQHAIEIDTYIEGFYNTCRVRYLSPMQWLKCLMDGRLKQTA